MAATRVHLTSDGNLTICGWATENLTATKVVTEATCQKCLRISQTGPYYTEFHLMPKLEEQLEKDDPRVTHKLTGYTKIDGVAQVYCGAQKDIPQDGEIIYTEDPLKVDCEACIRLMLEPTEVLQYAEEDVAMTVNACAPGLRYNRIHIQPRETWLENRLHELVVAIGQSKADSRPVPRDWVQEAHHILQELTSE